MRTRGGGGNLGNQNFQDREERELRSRLMGQQQQREGGGWQQVDRRGGGTDLGKGRGTEMEMPGKVATDDFLEERRRLEKGGEQERCRRKRSNVSIVGKVVIIR